MTSLQNARRTRFDKNLLVSIHGRELQSEHEIVLLLDETA